jgi:hypothetical protein
VCGNFEINAAFELRNSFPLSVFSPVHIVCVDMAQQQLEYVDKTHANMYIDRQVKKSQVKDYLPMQSESHGGGTRMWVPRISGRYGDRTRHGTASSHYQRF